MCEYRKQDLNAFIGNILTLAGRWVRQEELIGWLRRVEKLALVEVGKDEEEHIIKDMRKIIEFFNTLMEVNVEGVEPLFMTPRKEPLTREDVPVKGMEQSEALLNAKEVINGFVKGPKTI
ncbi:MAG: Asp-tRNA(Asn)/Glu-tRNA(Gln) amidotransferase GatCAB subunit C [Thermoprotei archaeon]|nr:MAG: Asp-tRNA(Asn)/Glu-tRNA(Gln) amidotransferase GatCAB subunit C [Thermoprotei archaeon]